MDFVLPKDCKKIEENEKFEIFGGSTNIEMNRGFLNKVTCTVAAASILNQGLVTGMTASEIAREIYAHAQVCYNAKYLQYIPGIRNFYASAADGIYLDDGGDTAVRKAFYDLVWTLT